MAEYPALTIWTDALLGDTQHLSATEFGAYLLTLIVAWRTPDCRLPDDDEYLARITRAGRNWSRIKPRVMAFWTLGEDGRWFQKRLLREREFVTLKSSKAAQSGKLGALKKKENRLANASKTLQRNGSSHTHTPLPTHSVSGTSSENPSDRIIPPPVGPAENWNDADLRQAFDHAASFCRHQAKLALVQLDPWISLGLTPAEIIQTVDAAIDWARRQPAKPGSDLGPNFHPNDFRWFKTFFENAVAEKSARARIAATPTRTSREIANEAASQPDAIRQRAVSELANACRLGRRPYGNWKAWIKPEHIRVAYEAGAIRLAWMDNAAVDLFPELQWYREATAKFRQALSSGRPLAKMTEDEYGIAEVRRRSDERQQRSTALEANRV